MKEDVVDSPEIEIMSKFTIPCGSLAKANTLHLFIQDKTQYFPG